MEKIFLSLVIDGSFYQPLESTRLTRTPTVRRDEQRTKKYVNLTIDQRIFLVVAQRQFDSIVKIDSVHNEM